MRRNGKSYSSHIQKRAKLPTLTLKSRFMTGRSIGAHIMMKGKGHAPIFSFMQRKLAVEALPLRVVSSEPAPLGQKVLSSQQDRPHSLALLSPLNPDYHPRSSIFPLRQRSQEWTITNQTLTTTATSSTPTPVAPIFNHTLHHQALTVHQTKRKMPSSVNSSATRPQPLCTIGTITPSHPLSRRAGDSRTPKGGKSNF